MSVGKWRIIFARVRRDLSAGSSKSAWRRLLGGRRTDEPVARRSLVAANRCARHDFELIGMLARAKARFVPRAIKLQLCLAACASASAHAAAAAVAAACDDARANFDGGGRTRQLALLQRAGGRRRARARQRRGLGASPAAAAAVAAAGGHARHYSLYFPPAAIE